MIVKIKQNINKEWRYRLSAECIQEMFREELKDLKKKEQYNELNEKYTRKKK